MKKYWLLTLSTVWMFAGLAQANDTAGYLLPTGEIRFEKQTGIVLKHEALLLSEKVTVDYLFENTTDKPVETTVFFPIPAVGPITAYWQTPHDFQFRVWSNGQEITPALNHQITLNGADVTAYFKQMGIDNYFKTIQTDPDTYGPDLENAAAPLRKLPVTEQKKLAKLGMLAKGCMQEEETIDPCEQALRDYQTLPILEFDADFAKEHPELLPSYLDLRKGALSPQEQILAHYPQCKRRLSGTEPVLPTTTAQCTHNPDVYHLVPADYKQEAMYYWTQTFPPHQTVHIHHEYKPSFMENSVGAPREFVSKTTDWDYEKPHDFWKEATYIITTANNWQTPIGQFHLLVWGQNGAAVSAYKDGEPSHTRVAPKNYLLETRQDFVPTREILFELASKTHRAPDEPNISVFPQLYRVDGPARVRKTPNGKKITTLENGRYVWAYPSEKEDWFVVLLDEKTTGYTHRTNLIPFGKLQ